jgi:hypothetical protein
MLGTPKVRAGKTQRRNTATKIAETFFDPISDVDQKGKLLDEVVLIVAGQAESDKMRLALACLDSLVRFEEVMHADTHLDYNNSKEVSGAHMATLPQKGLKLDSEYSRFTGLDHKKFGKLRERLVCLRVCLNTSQGAMRKASLKRKNMQWGIGMKMRNQECLVPELDRGYVPFYLVLNWLHVVTSIQF